MTELLVKKARLEARYAELDQRLQAIRQDYAAGLDADSEERAVQLANSEVLAEISRVTEQELAEVAAELDKIAQLLASQ